MISIDIRSARYLIRYLVVRRLVEPVSIDIVYDHYVNSTSLRVLCKKYNIKFNRIRRLIGTINKRVDYLTAGIVIEKAYNILKSIEPVVEISDGVPKCLLCDYTAPMSVYVKRFTNHIIYCHRNYVDMYVEKIIKYLFPRK